MSDAVNTTTPTSDSVPARRPWTLPSLSELPKLTKLTLASAIGGGGGTSGGGSTVFSLLFALGTALGLGACSSGEAAEPGSEGPGALTSVPITCRVDITAGAMDCTGPAAAPGREILGRQGEVILLRSSNTSAAAGTFTTEVTIQNVGAQPIGTEYGDDNDSIYVFFPSDPVPDAGTVSVVANSATFMAANQKFYPYPGPLLNGATSSAVTWTFSYSGATSFTFEVLVAASVPAQGGIRKWNVVEGPHAPWIRGVAAYGPEDALVVNNGVDFPRLTSAGWGRIANPFPDGLVDVSVTSSANSYIAVGNLTATTQGFVAWYRNNGWETIRTEPASKDRVFHSVWADSKERWIAVGEIAGTDSGLIVWRWGSSDTVNVKTFANVGPIKFVDADPANTVGVAQGQNSHVYWFTSGSWASLGGWGTVNSVGAGVAMSTANPGHFAWAHNTPGGTPVGEVYTYSGTTFQSKWSSNDYAVSGITRDGTGGVYVMAHWTKGGYQFSHYYQADEMWDSFTKIGELLWNRPRRPVYDGAGGLFVRDTMGLYRANMVDISVAEVAADLDATSYSSLFAVGDDLYLGTTSGMVRKRIGGAWSENNTGAAATIRDLWGTGECDMYTVAAAAIYHRDCSSWSLEGGVAIHNAITGAGGTVAAVGTGVLSTKVSGVWTGLTTGVAVNGGSWWDVWASSESNIYAVGDNYHVARWDGVSWSRVALPAVSNADSTAISWKGIGGSGANDIWVVGSAGHALHWDGATWTVRDVASGPTFEKVVSTGSNVAMIGSGQGSWIAVPSQITRASDTRVTGTKGMAKGSGSTVWALGESQLFVGTR